MVHQIKIVQETPMTLSEVKSELERIKKRDGELGFRASKAEDYLNTFSKLSEKDSNSLLEEIESLKIPRLAREHIVKIANILPETLDDLKVLLQGYTITLSKESQQKIIDVVAKFI